MTDRRIHPRTDAIENRAALEWGGEGSDPRGTTPRRDVDTRMGGGDPRGTTPCRIVDISRGGALVEFEPSTCLARRILIRIDSPAITGWASARVARSDGPGLVALAFEDECPTDLYAAACAGIALRPVDPRGSL
jgi:hypothetical protein